MRSSMLRLRAAVPAVVDGRGELAGRYVWLEYYTTEPAPGSWVAVGAVTRRAASGVPPRALRMLVGAGRSEAQAVDDLSRRFGQLDRGAGLPRAATGSLAREDAAGDPLAAAS